MALSLDEFDEKDSTIEVVSCDDLKVFTIRRKSLSDERVENSMISAMWLKHSGSFDEESSVDGLGRWKLLHPCPDDVMEVIVAFVNTGISPLEMLKDHRDIDASFWCELWKHSDYFGLDSLMYDSGKSMLLDIEMEFDGEQATTLGHRIIGEDGDSRLGKLLLNRFWLTVYRASRDGFSADDFHEKCDEKGETIVLVKTLEGAVIGGYASACWSKRKIGWESAPDSFIFSLCEKEDDSSELDYCLTEYVVTESGTENGVYHRSSFGPAFGMGHDLYICSNSDTEEFSHSNPSGDYIPKTSKGLVSKPFLVAEIEVLYSPN